MRKKLKELALQNNCITEGFAIHADYSLMDEFWEGAPWQKRKTLIVTYEYFIHDKRYFKDIKFVCHKEVDGTFRTQYPFQIRIYYSAKNLKKTYWETNDNSINIVKKE